MAFNWQTFKTRALTAVIFVVVMLAGLLWNKWSFFLLFSVVHFGAWNEYRKLVEKFNPDYSKIIPFHRYGIMLGGWCLMLFFTNSELHIAALTLTEAGFWIGVLFMILLPLIMFLESKEIFLKNIGYSLFGLLYISLSLALLTDLRMTPVLRYTWGMEFSLFIILFIILSLWINDTMAYIVGSLIGRTPFSKVSPKKTWEGTAGGALLCIIVMSLTGYYAGLPLVHGICISGIAAVTGTIGDLFESKMKRMAGVKDSGNIMPGHGGFLDRFDSLLFAATCCWIYIRIFMITD
jgi:phosphatidate cytidylyltransferase